MTLKGGYLIPRFMKARTLVTSNWALTFASLVSELGVHSPPRGLFSGGKKILSRTSSCLLGLDLVSHVCGYGGKATVRGASSIV
ncbi:hypothetical protein RSAG8_06810, partial [Rhizoctonia solani AG-8 WAC10335]